MKALFLTVVLALTPPAFSEFLSPIGRNVTAVSLTRAEFDRLSGELSNQPVDLVFKRFAAAYDLDALLTNVNARIPDPAWEADIVQKYIQTWIVTLVLAKNGFQAAAERQFLSGITKTGIAAEKWARNRYGSRNAITAFLADVAASAILETMVKFGSLKSSESNRIYAQLKQSAQTLRSYELRKGIRTNVADEYMTGDPAENFLEKPTTVPGLLGCTAGLVTSIVCVGPVFEFLSDILGSQAIALVVEYLSAPAVIVTGMGIGGSIPLSFFYAYGLLRARVPLFPNIAARCEALLDGDLRRR